VSKREFKALVVDDFRVKWLGLMAKDEGRSLDETYADYDTKDLFDLSDRLSGRVVTLIHCTYSEGKDDYFEKVDNNWVIFKELFTEVSPQ